MKTLQVLILGGKKNGEETTDLITAFSDAHFQVTHSTLRDILILNTGKTFACFLEKELLSKNLI